MRKAENAEKDFPICTKSVTPPNENGRHKKDFIY